MTPIVGKTNAVFNPKFNNNSTNYLSQKKDNQVAFTAKIPLISTIRKAERDFFAPYTKANDLANVKFETIKEKAKEVIIKTIDNISLKCWDIKPKGKKPYIIYCHGLKTNLTRSAESMEILAKDGFGVFGVEYTGYAGHCGQSKRANHKKDLNAAYEYLKKKGIPDNKIGIMGESMGGGIAVDFAKEHKGLFAASIVSSLSSTQELLKVLLDRKSHKIKLSPSVKKILKFIPESLIPVENNYNNAKNVGKIDCPIQFVHSRYDHLIPARMSKKQAASARKTNPHVRLDIVKEGGHFTIKEKQESILSFLNELLKK